MTISRMQQPRQLYGLGSFVKSITKGVKSAVKGVTDVAKSPLGLAALGLGTAGLFGAGPLSQLAGTKLGTTLAGLKSSPLFTGASKFFEGEKTFGKTLAMFGLGSLGGAALSALEASGAKEEDIRDIDSLRSYLRQGYMQLNPGAKPEDVDAFVEQNTVEYRADGGRIGYAEGNPDQKQMAMVEDMLKRGMDMSTIKSITGASDEMIQDRINFIKYGGAKVPVEKANGGRIGYARGDTAEENAMQASGIMGLPLNENPAGVTELDLRETGGFIPPVGVKEKADDIPAMLSNNEFVFTADAVRGMGNGDVNKGAERMYAMMKKLENGGRV